MKACLAATLILALLADASASRPDILFIVSDDQGPDTIHALGNKIIQTPNLDRLAAHGTVFTRAIAAATRRSRELAG